MLERIVVMACRLALPKRLKIYPVFYVSFLKQYHGDDGRAVQRRVPPVVSKEYSRRVHRILEHRKIGTYIKFLVQWAGESVAEATWDRATNL